MLQLYILYMYFLLNHNKYTLTDFGVNIHVALSFLSIRQ